MQRIFVPNQLDDEIKINGEDYHHLVEVLRYEVGQVIEISDYNGNLANYEIKKISPLDKSLIVKMIEKIKNDSELPVDVTLVCALTKGKKIDETVEKGTEFGANHFIFYSSQYTPLTYPENWCKKKTERLNKIALTAAKQSHRNIVPTVTIQKELDWERINCQYKFLAYEKAKDEDKFFKNALEKIKSGTKVCCAFGPEGGFTPLEVEEYEKHGFNSISLGKRILRAENAPLLFLSVLAFYFEL